MDFVRGLLAARSHLAFLGGLALAAAVVYGVGLVTPGDTKTRRQKVQAGNDRPFAELLGVEGAPALAPTGVALDEADEHAARIAWRYFENNLQPDTGLVNSNDRYPSTTLWDLGSYVMGLLSAERLGLIDADVAGERLRTLLDTLARLPLVGPGLPNKAYDTRSLAVVDYENRPVEGGIGWSAIDVARVGVPFTVLLWRHPELTGAMRRVLGAWRLERMVEGGQLIGGDRRGGRLVRVQEGRLGYEQYAAKSLFLLGLDVSRALDPRAFAGVAEVQGQRIAYDVRQPSDYGGAHNGVLSEPYVLEGLEFGFDDASLAIARAVFRAQENRFRATGRLTAVSEDNLDRPPYFVYSTVLANREPWAVFTPQGKDARAFRTLSLKTAFGWSVLFAGDYAGRLREAVRGLSDEQRGWYAGVYESDGTPNKALTANTNGIVLEALAYKVHGAWLPDARRP